MHRTLIQNKSKFVAVLVLQAANDACFMKKFLITHHATSS